jgi:hypothetical protein
MTVTDTPAAQNAYPQLVARYRNARRQYRQLGVANSAAALGMDEQEYCRRFVAEMGPIVTQTGAVSMANIAWLEGAAYDEAGLQDARASALSETVGRAGQVKP